MSTNNIEVVISAKDYATKTLDNIKKEFWEIGSWATEANKWINDIWNSLKRLIKISWWLYLANKIKEMSDSFLNMQNRLRQITDENNLWKLQEQMLNMANASRVPVEDFTKTFVRLDLAMKQYGGTQEHTAIIMDSLSKGLSSTWATATEAGSAMLQLSQAFGSWVLQWDEFRSLAENMPLILDVLSKSMGVTRWELKKLWADWKITWQVLAKALIEANWKINESFNKSQITIWQKMTQIKNSILVNFWEIEKKYGLTDMFIDSINIIYWAFKRLATDIFSIMKSIGNIYTTTMDAITQIFWQSSKKQLWFMQAISLWISFLWNWFWVLTDLIVEAQKINIGVFKDIWNNIKVLWQNAYIVFYNLWQNIHKALSWDFNFVPLNNGFKELPWMVNASSASINWLSKVLTNNENRFKSLVLDIDNIWKTSVNSVPKVEGLSQQLSELLSWWWISGWWKWWASKAIDNIKKLWEEATEVANKLQEWIISSNSKYKEWQEELKKMWIEFKELKIKWVENLKEIANKFNDLKKDWIARIKELETGFDEFKKKWIDSILELRWKLNELKNWLWDIWKKGAEDLANRVIEIEDKQKNITQELLNQNLELEKRKTLEEEQIKLAKELELAKWNVKQEDIDKTRLELNKSETQKILDRVAMQKAEQETKIANLDEEILKQKELNKIEEEKLFLWIAKEKEKNTLELNNIRAKVIEQKAINDKEQAEFIVKMDIKKAEIQKEYDLYNSLVLQKMQLDNLYFENFWAKIKIQMDETQKAITLLESLKNKSWGSSSVISWARATWWPVWNWKTYLVWERWPELFTPKSSWNITPNNQLWWINISINMWWVVANNSTDINSIWEIVSQKIVRQLQLYKMWIA